MHLLFHVFFAEMTFLAAHAGGHPPGCPHRAGLILSKKKNYASLPSIRGWTITRKYCTQLVFGCIDANLRKYILHHTTTRWKALGEIYEIYRLEFSEYVL